MRGEQVVLRQREGVVLRLLPLPLLLPLVRLLLLLHLLLLGCLLRLLLLPLLSSCYWCSTRGERPHTASAAAAAVVDAAAAIAASASGAATGVVQGDDSELPRVYRVGEPRAPSTGAAAAAIASG